MKLISIVFVFCALLIQSQCLPRPQESDPGLVDTSRFDIVETDSDADNQESDTTKSDDSSDEDESENPIGDLVGGFFELIQGAIGQVQEIAEDENVAKTVGGLLEAGVNATGQILAAGGELLQSAPEVLERSGQVAESIVKTTNESRPILNKNLKELERFGDLFSKFLRQYTDVAVKNLNDFLKVYDRRFKCHSECKDKTGRAMELCNQLYCEGFDSEYFEFDEDLDYLVEIYGDLDELEKQQAEKRKAESDNNGIKPRDGADDV